MPLQRVAQRRLAFALAILWGWQVATFAAGPDITQVSKPASELNHSRSGNTASGKCHLRFFRKDWATVLKQVAEETHSELVMPQTPPGIFSRVDFGEHSREEAVRILNRDLEKLGYRLVADNDVLEVVTVKREFPEYERHEVLPTQSPAAAPVDMTAQPGGNAAAQAHAAKPADIRQAAHEEPSAEAKPTNGPLKIVPQHRPAVEIAKQIHSTFRERAEVKEKGPNGFPAFVVKHFAEPQAKAGTPLFELEIDSENNTLLITAEPAVREGLQTLIGRLDVPASEADKLPQLMAGEGATAETGEKLKAPLSEMAQERGKSPPAAEQPSESNDSGEAAAGLPALLGNLKGDVSIEALNDLDLLILRGNQADVDSVMQVIRAIEQMAVGSLPEIHLLRLRFVDSQSLAQLLNDVYERMTELRTNNAQQSQVSVRVVPVVTPNAVLILAPATAMDAVLQLADELDQQIDPTHQVQIFRLKHAVATSVAEMLENFYEQPPVGLATRLKVAADPRTNSVIVQATPRDLTEIAEFIRGVDSEQAGAVNQLRVFELKSAVAEELASFLNNTIQSILNPPRMTGTTGQGGLGQGGFGQQQQTSSLTDEARATVLEFLDEGGKELIRSGLLNEIRFNADPRTNTLLVTAPEQSMLLVEELVRMLDRPSSALAVIKVFPLQNADAANAVELLQELFNTNQTGQTGQNAQQGALGVELFGAEGSGSSLVPLRFSVDVRSNSVVAIGGEAALRIVDAILRRLDSNDARNRQTTVIKLRNSPAADVAAAINEFLQAQRELATLDPERISTSQLLEQEIIVTAEPVTNSLLISATPTYFKQLEEIAKKLDAEPPQVVIQAMLVEVELDNTDEFGVELGFQDPVLFDRSIIDNILTITQTSTPVGQPQTTNTTIVSQSASPGFNFNNQSLGNNNGPSSNPSVIGTQGLTNFSVGRVNSELGYGGLVLSASSESVNVLIRALAARRTVRVLSRPQIMALDNQTAQIQVGQVVPVTDGVTVTGTGIVNPTIIRDAAGIILTVSPRISPEGQIVMEVAAEKSLYGGATVPIFTDASTGTTIESPIKDITTARTTVKVPDGQTIVVGGMITKTDQNVERKVPWLGDLPWIGQVFRYDLFEFRRTELLIFLTPRVVHNDADAELIKQVEAGRMHFFQDDVEAVHGPIFGRPNQMNVPMQNGPVIEGGPVLDCRPPVNGTLPVPPEPTPSMIDPLGAEEAKPIRDSGVKQLGTIPIE